MPILFFLLICQAAFAGEASRTEYLDLLHCFPKLISSQGDFSQGEIQIILDPKEMAAIEKETGRDVGILMKDKYWLWVNDACLFPNGKKGVYGRILWVKSMESHPGVAVMPITQEGKIILNCNFRHSTRSWEIELPRGVINLGEDSQMAARRETMEETGMLVSDLRFLGEIPPDTGMTNTIVPIYLAKVQEKRKAQPEDSEAIEEILSLTISEVKQAFLRGYYEQRLRGVPKRIPFRDPFLAYALMIYELQCHLD